MFSSIAIENTKNALYKGDSQPENDVNNGKSAALSSVLSVNDVLAQRAAVNEALVKNKTASNCSRGSNDSMLPRVSRSKISSES